MTSKFKFQVIDRPLRGKQGDKAVERLASLHTEIRELAKLCLNPLPNYQILSDNTGVAFENKLLVLARDAKNSNKLIGFVSAVFLPIDGLHDPLLHTGLTVIHPDYRKTGLVHQLFANIFYQLISTNPKGLWLSTRAAVITSLVHIAKHTTKVFPSPEWEAEHPEGPSDTHLLIAREITKKHRGQMLISPQAEFDESKFVCLGSNNTEEGQAFMKDVDNVKYWHHDRQSSEFYRRLLRRGMGDEVLQISFLDPEHVKRMAGTPRFREQWQYKYSKL